MGLFSSKETWTFDYTIKYTADGLTLNLNTTQPVVCVSREERVGLIGFLLEINDLDSVEVELYEREGRKRII